MAHLLLSVIGAVAQFERDLIRERSRKMRPTTWAGDRSRNRSQLVSQI